MHLSKYFAAAAAILLWAAPPSLAANCTPYSFALTNGQTADANQVMSNFNNVLNCANNNLAHNAANSDITSLGGLTTPLPVSEGGTGATTLTAHGLPVGNGAAPPTFLLPGASGNVATSNGTDWVSQASTVSAPLYNALAANVALTDTTLFFAGPAVAQGSVGTWFFSGTVTLQDLNAGSAFFTCKLWDGATVIASSVVYGNVTNGFGTIALSGLLATPAGNGRISCNDANNTSNASIISSGTTGAASTITALRVQ